jgi:hypothetical protein
MSVAAILLPVFVQVALTFVLLIRLGSGRLRTLKAGKTKVRDIALGESNWPADVTQVGNCFNNQFQLPLLFYVLTALALVLRKADLLFVIMAWIFVVTRIVHAGIHVTSNNVNQRFAAYTAGMVVLMLMWAIFAVRILFGLA